MTTARRFFFCITSVLIAGIFTAWSATILTNAAANLVLGQTLFTTNTSPTPATASSLNLPASVAIDSATGKIFVADQSNNRVLRYASQSALVSGAPAELAIGQVNFSSSAANQNGGVIPSQSSLSSPGAVFVDTAGNLWIADTGNSRVLMFANAANLTSMPAQADRVFGQPDFVSYLADHTQTKLGNPLGVCVDPAGTLWVADTGSHRVLGWKTAASVLVNGAPADRVLGQQNFTSNTADHTQTTMFNPSGVAADASRLWVADRDNNRVLLFQNYPSINGAPANLVLGQTTYTTNTAATSAVGLNTPTGVAISGANLWICDSGNNRVTFYPSVATIVPGGAATVVVGQAALTTGSAGLSSQALSLLNCQIAVDAVGNLFVADRLNNRALRFAATTVAPTPTPTPNPATTAPTIALTGKPKIATTHAVVTLRGTASVPAGIRRVSYNLNDEGYIRAQGTTNWKAKVHLPFGRSEIIINSVSLDGPISLPLKVIVTRK